MANLRVLVADSDSAFRAQAQNALTRQGYFVVPVDNGTDALARLDNGPIDVAVVEVALPEQDGLEILHAAQTRATRLPVILLAEPRNIGTAAIGVRAGAFDYLVKPVDDLTRLALLIDRAAGRFPVTEPPAVTKLPPSEPDQESELAPARFLEALAAGQDLDTLLNLFAAELASVAHAAHTLVLLAHNDNQLHLVASHGFSGRPEAAKNFINDIGEGFATQVATDREWIWADPSETTAEALIGGAQMFGLPLCYSEQVLGVALAQGTMPRDAFPSERVSAIRQLAQQAAIGVELARVSARAKRLETRDPVTGLANRDYFFEIADRDFRRAWRFNQPLAAIIVDVDDFGKLHLMLGPDESDRVIQQIAQLTRRHLRSVDLVGRLDTDKLGVVLLMAKKEHALAVAERLRRVIGELELTLPDEVWHVTASLGVASYPRDHCASVHDLFSIAEQATRAAKRAGRNRVEGI